MNMLAYLAARMKEASSWAGTVGIILGIVHVTASSDLVNAALGIVVALGGLIAVLVPEKGGAKKIAGMLLALALGGALGACAQVKAAADLEAKFAATPAGQALIAWGKGFKPAVEAEIAKLHDSPATIETVHMLCGGANTLHTLFGAAALFAPIPSYAVTLEHANFAAVEIACNVAETGRLPSGHDIAALVADWQSTFAALAERGLKL